VSAPANRATLRKMYWRPPLRRFTILINLGLLLIAATLYDWIFFHPNLPPGAPFPWAKLIPVVLVGLAGLILLTVGIIARNQRALTLLPHRCLQCGTLNPPDARFCSGCGARFEPA